MLSFVAEQLLSVLGLRPKDFNFSVKPAPLFIGSGLSAGFGTGFAAGFGTGFAAGFGRRFGGLGGGAF